MMLRVENLSFWRCSPISFEIGSGECAYLTGPSGCGKTLMLRAIADLDPHEGRVYLDDSESRSVPAPAWRQQVGLLPAEPVWWFDTVGEHFPEVRPTWMEELGFSSETLDWEVARLSTGEKRRLALLRLLVQGPKALLLDEPTANLDDEHAQKVEDLVVRYRDDRQVPVLWVSHRGVRARRQSSQAFRLTADHQFEQEQI